MKKKFFSRNTYFGIVENIKKIVFEILLLRFKLYESGDNNF